MSTQTDKKKIKIDNGTTYGKVYTDVASDAKYAGKTEFDALETKVSDLANDMGNKQDKLTAGTNVSIANNVISVPNIPTKISYDSQGRLGLFDGDTDLSEDYVYLGSGIETYTKNGHKYIDVASVSVDAYTKTESDAKYATKTELSNQKSTLEDEISLKQNTLTAGDGISISNNVISATSSGSSIGELVLTTAQYQALTTQGYTTLTDDQMSEFTNSQVNIKYNSIELYRITVNKVLTNSGGSKVYYYYLNAIGSDYELDGGMVKSYASRVDIANKRIYMDTEKTLISDNLMKTINGVSLYESTPSTSVTDISLSDIGAQPKLVSGTNIKTINNESILGSGNISISGGGGDSAVGTIELTASQISSFQQGSITFTSDNLTVMKTYPIVYLTYNNIRMISLQVQCIINISSQESAYYVTACNDLNPISSDFSFMSLWQFAFYSTSTTYTLNINSSTYVYPTILTTQHIINNCKVNSTSLNPDIAVQFYVHNILMTYESSSASFQVRFQITNNQSDTYNSLSYLTGYLGTAFVQGCTGYANNGTYGQAYSVTPSKVYAIIDGAQATIDYTTTGLTITDTIKEMS